MHDLKKILVITTGGTIDALYHPEDGTPSIVPLSDQTGIGKALDHAGYKGEYDLYPLCQRDSKQIHTPTLQHIAHYIAEHDHDYDSVIVTHGTDTMPVHARKLKALLAEYEISPKTVIFTGGMEPLRDVKGQWRESADGWQHLSESMKLAQQHPAGVYLVVEGKTCDAETLNKNVVLTPDNMVSDAEFIARDPRNSQIIID